MDSSASISLVKIPWSTREVLLPRCGDSLYFAIHSVSTYRIDVRDSSRDWLGIRQNHYRYTSSSVLAFTGGSRCHRWSIVLHPEASFHFHPFKNYSFNVSTFRRTFFFWRATRHCHQFCQKPRELLQVPAAFAFLLEITLSFMPSRGKTSYKHRKFAKFPPL